MTRFLIAFLALLGLAAQAPACPRLVETRPEVGLYAAQRVAAQARQAAVAGLLLPAAPRAVRPLAIPADGRPVAALMARVPVLTGIDRARE
ncbi:hypothetical protein [Novosphingobium sp.]|uniref:hypothetical protein n=1 Tax=Novosphingobium sp. TaxID=1874826 RepID=UPI002601C9D0|nr:hypothetical protein [Novosphingobium sp.]